MGILGNVKLAQWDGKGEDGSPHPRGHGSGSDGRGWVPASARTREGEKMGPRIREDTGRGRRWVPAFARTREGEKMGPRIREDTGRGEDGSPHSRGHGRGRRWVPASARTREGEKVILRFALTRLGLGHSI